jgi:DNA modification methylase
MIELIHGDCLELMKDIPDKSIDMILCDLPYGTTACKWDVVIPFEPLWEQYKRIIKDRGCIALFGSEPFSSYLRMSNIKQYKYDWIWDKVRPSGFQIAKYVPMKRHELISIFNQTTPKWNPQKEKRNKPIKGRVCSASDSSPLKYNDGMTRTYTDKNPQSILVFSKQSDGKYVHPTQKPVALLEYLIKTYTLENETILDNCMGSGSTGVACVNTNRNFIGIEKDYKYFEIAKNRIEQTQQDVAPKV